MPQDELWRASARLTGWSMSYHLDIKGDDVDMLGIATHWAKQPTDDRSTSVILDVPTYCRWQVPQIMERAHGELLGGLPRNLRGVAQGELRRIRSAYQEGAMP